MYKDKGYRVKIEDTIIPNTLIAKGSYSFQKEPRQIREWKDGNGIRHEDIYEKRKVSIKFSIKERKLEEQQTICGIFQKVERLTVEYWDDYLCEYKTGQFKMYSDAISHSNADSGSIYYKSTNITLEEY